MSQPILADLSRAFALVALLTVLTGFSGTPSPKVAKTTSLSCRVHGDQIEGTFRAPVAAEFVWSAAHGTDEATGPIKTSIGQIYQGAGTGPATILTLNGKALRLPGPLAGSIRFGRLIDYGGKVALAYLVEREEDSSASPSQVVLLLGPQGDVLETDLQPGTASSPGDHCVLIQ